MIHKFIRSLGLLAAWFLATSWAVAADPQGQSEGAHFDGEWRTFFLSTTNRGALKDWASLATGGNLGVISAPYWGLRLGVRGYAATEVVGNASTRDQSTLRPSRYELGLYDVADAHRREIALVGEAYVEGTWGPFELWVGRKKIQTPLLNPQDGRMIPTLAQGGWLRLRPLHGLTLQAGAMTHVAPRGTARFYRMADSVGLYPQGRTVNGQPANYHGHIQSAGLFTAAVGYEKGAVSISVWDYYFQNVFNTVYAELSLRLPYEAPNESVSSERLGSRGTGSRGTGSQGTGSQGTGSQGTGSQGTASQGTASQGTGASAKKTPSRLSMDLQMLAQQRLALGGLDTHASTAPSLAESTYFEQPAAYAFGGRVNFRPAPPWLLRIAYNRITGHGRFVFPREWGREPLYTFQKRERSEGSGNQHSALVEVERIWGVESGTQLSLSLGNGLYLRPFPSEPALNKYALPSLYQFNFDAVVRPGRMLPGWKFEALVAYKVALGTVTTNSAWVQNKVDMVSWNFVASYRF